MVLTVDIGNSAIKIGAYNYNKELLFTNRITTNRTCPVSDYAARLQDMCTLHNINRKEVEYIILSSVVPTVTTTFSEALHLVFKIHPQVLSQALQTGITVDIENPTELGSDILASAVAIAARFPLPSINIDMGTATTITALSADKRILGVSIATGAYTALDALVGKAAQLQGITIEAPPKAIGRNTVHSMQSGAVFGNAAMLDGIIARFVQEMGEVKTIVATGGAGGNIIPHCQTPITYLPYILLDGLYEVYLMNKDVSC